jgi:hypothetical protein
MAKPPDLETLSSAELKVLVMALLARVSKLEHTVVAQRDEIARLKGRPGRPAIKPSGMEDATQPAVLRGGPAPASGAKAFHHAASACGGQAMCKPAAASFQGRRP